MNLQNNLKTIKKIGTTNSYLSITLNVNELSLPIKRRRMTEWIFLKAPTISCLSETQFSLRTYI